MAAIGAWRRCAIAPQIPGRELDRHVREDRLLMGIRANLISRPRPRPLPSAPALSREVKCRGALEATVRSHRSPARFPCGPCGCRGCRQQVALAVAEARPA